MPTRKKTTLAIIDADPYVYEIAFSIVRKVEIDGEIVEMADPEEGRGKLDAYLRDVIHSVGAQHSIVCLSDATANWRMGVYPDYKGKRSVTKRPGCYGELRRHLMSHRKAVIWKRLEADDLVGILATDLSGSDRNRVIVSIDKDLLTVPGLHYNPRKPEKGVFEVTRAEAFLNHMRQTLTGDAVDNYPGCPGVGPKKAEKFLGDYDKHPTSSIEHALWKCVLSAYGKAGLPPSVAIVQARIAHILQHGDYCTNTNEVKLWQPPTK